MAITDDDVRHVAQLARLLLSESEIQPLARDLSRILEHVQQLEHLDTQGVELTAHLAVSEAPLRHDESVAGVDQPTALREAPRSVAGGFVVPGFVDE